MNTKKIYLGLTILTMSFSLLSCNKWLDVEPKSQVRDTDLFSTESGFKEALAGVYASLTYEPLYGREMTFGLMGVLGYEWDYQALAYDADKIFEYQNSQVSLGRIDAIWNGVYTAISNNNKLLESIDARKSVFSPDNYEVIKGEALALRAFMHFDLLRIFGASYEENPSKMAIPYFKKSSKEIAPQLKVAEIIDLAIADLNEAAELLKRDPLITGRTVTTIDDNGYLMNRQLHLNYYAVKGLLARIYLYKKDLPKALENAETVINANKFPWIQKVNLEIETRADLVFSTEHLFALNVTRLNTIYQNSFTTTGGSNVFYISKASRTEYYENAAEDFRYLYWFTETNEGNFFLKKYAQRTEATWPVAYRNKMPMIKLPEMYFIAAEALKATNITRAAELINTVRTHRGLALAPIDASNFDAVLLQEFRKEFIGEGQLFFYHKRKNTPRIPRGTNYDIIALKGYKLPIPVSEFNNAPGRVDNR
ncbi:RagB/SusD family nutrient uptake outer membrane protein [Pedobacter hiemivivus]|uniref:RagB/SusD family nutrient uptake outer membrane protein n=1 Tax=Pedobacter hiemivivus TaxID=2530454 RepID=A0A4R0NDD2_9SPHI|nr:RagB/SusD family nutrient uptake outer membrane protein [Pedobacter hiemivivus]TCC97082.1 RagB/SusD family nutrient uptake outer membrane protein [Pedobacter hiemivivus]